MFQSIWEDAKREFNYGNMVTQLVIVNVAVFLLVNIISIGFFLAGQPGKFSAVIDFLSLSSKLTFNLTHPWVIFTHMFLHGGFWHILWNMLMLYWFGRIVGDFLGNQRVLPLYLLGGLAGALAYFLSAQLSTGLLPIGSSALGASAAVMAIVVASGVTAPNYTMNLILLGPVKLKYIVAVLILIDLFSIAQIAPNAGGSIAHLGGALFGWFFVYMLREGNDMANPVNQLINTITRFFKQLFGGQPKRPPRKKPHVAYKNKDAAQKATRKTRSRRGNAKSDYERLSQQERVDAILDKIKQSGYDSLSQEEKEILFKASKD